MGGFDDLVGVDPPESDKSIGIDDIKKFERSKNDAKKESHGDVPDYIRDAEKIDTDKELDDESKAMLTAELDKCLRDLAPLKQIKKHISVLEKRCNTELKDKERRILDILDMLRWESLPKIKGMGSFWTTSPRWPQIEDDDLMLAWFEEWGWSEMVVRKVPSLRKFCNKRSDDFAAKAFVPKSKKLDNGDVIEEPVLPAGVSIEERRAISYRPTPGYLATSKITEIAGSSDEDFIDEIRTYLSGKDIEDGKDKG